MKVFSEKIDLLNLPNPNTNLGEDTIKADIHPFDFLYDDETDITDDIFFSYFYYNGSKI